VGLLALAAASWLVGCGAPVELRRPVTVVPTKTPGLAYVIVHPVTKTSKGDAAPRIGDVHRNSDYILLCDGRFGDGMRCSIPDEVAFERASEHPESSKRGADVRQLPGSGESGAASASPPPGAPTLPTQPAPVVVP
jgi:hypothetical protein